MKHVREQVEFLKLDEVISIIIKFLKNCPDELINMRSDLVYRMKTFLTCKRENNIPDPNEKMNEIMQNIIELLDDEGILGKNVRLAPTTRSNMQSYWLEIVRVIILNYLPRQEQQNSSNPLDRMFFEFLTNQIYMEKIFDMLTKLLFDPTTHNQVIEKYSKYI